MFLVHSAGPFWMREDLGVRSIPKGEFTDETPLEAAKREFQEETSPPAKGDLYPLETIQQASGKIAHAWAVEDDCDTEAIPEPLLHDGIPAPLRPVPLIPRGGSDRLARRRGSVGQDTQEPTPPPRTTRKTACAASDPLLNRQRGCKTALAASR